MFYNRHIAMLISLTAIVICLAAISYLYIAEGPVAPGVAGAASALDDLYFAF